MRQFIGTKVINAMPMTRQEYNDFRGWQLPADENGSDPGFLVEYTDGGQANTPQYAGYVSWSPQGVFERSYRPTQGMTFGQALEALKINQKVARSGWNGKGMWLSLSGSCDGHLIEADKFWSPHNRAHAVKQGGYARVLPSITMKTATGEILMGWLASQTDMLAEDWEIVQ